MVFVWNKLIMYNKWVNNSFYLNEFGFFWSVYSVVIKIKGKLYYKYFSCNEYNIYFFVFMVFFFFVD